MKPFFEWEIPRSTALAVQYLLDFYTTQLSEVVVGQHANPLQAAWCQGYWRGLEDLLHLAVGCPGDAIYETFRVVERDGRTFARVERAGAR
jgi:hypothetical protein